MTSTWSAPDGTDETLLIQAIVGGQAEMRNYALNKGETSSVKTTINLDTEYLELTGAGALLMTYARASVDPQDQSQHILKLTVGGEFRSFGGLTATTIKNAKPVSLYLPKLADLVDANGALDVSVHVSSGADGAEISFSQPELLAATAPVSAGCHGGLSALALGEADDATMTPKECLKICLRAKKRFAYVAYGNRCACEEKYKNELNPKRDEDCKVSIMYLVYRT